MQDRIDRWKRFLEIAEIQEFAIETELDTHFQRRIQKDVDRTRKRQISPQERERLEVWLTHYCKEENITYKQGLNEIAVVFVYFTRFGILEHVSYRLFKCFVKTVCPTMFVDEAFRPLNGLFQVFRLLLVYHCPLISNFLSDRELTPEIFATPWFITLFSNRVQDFDLLLEMWEVLIKEKDVFFPCYLAVALLESAKSYFLSEHIDTIVATDIFMNIKISNQAHMNRVLTIARRLKENMPYSAVIRLKKYNIYNLDIVDSLVGSLSKEKNLAILSREVLQRTYPEEKFCQCIDNTCQWCERTNSMVPLVLLDCRTPKEQKGGLISNSALIEPQIFNDSSLFEEVPDLYLSMRGTFHISLMGSGRNSTVVNTLVDVFVAKGFKYISIVEGGYESCHEFMIQYDLPIAKHNPQLCKLCRPSKSPFFSSLKTRFKNAFASKSRRGSEESSGKAPEVQEKQEELIGAFRCWKYDDDFDSLISEEVVKIYLTKIKIKSEDTEFLIGNLNTIKRNKKRNTIIILSFRPHNDRKYFKFLSEDEANECLSTLKEMYNLNKNEA